MSGTDTQRTEHRHAANGCNRLQRELHRGLGWRELREHGGMSLRDLEDLTGINRGDLSKIERGHGPTPPQARRLILIFGPQIA